MKIRHILVAAMALPQLALADLPITRQGLGTVQAALDFCAQINPGGAAKYREHAEYMMQGVSREELAELRAADEYKEVYLSVSTALGQVATQEAVETCSSFLVTDAAGK